MVSQAFLFLTPDFLRVFVVPRRAVSCLCPHFGWDETGKKPLPNQAALYEHVQEKLSFTDGLQYVRVFILLALNYWRLAEKGFPSTQQ